MKKISLQTLLSVAPNYTSIDELCANNGISVKSFYNYTSENIEMREKITDALGSRYSFSFVQAGDKQVITISIDEARRANVNSFSEQERRDISDIICYGVEKGVSVTDTCRLLKIHPTTFFKWVNPDSTIAFRYAIERYKAAKESHKLSSNDELVFTAHQALKQKLSDRKVENVTEVYEIRGGDEQPVLKERRVTDKTYMPDMSAIALTLNNLDVDFRKATAGGQMLPDDANMREMDEDELQALLKEEIEKGRILNGG